MVFSINELFIRIRHCMKTNSPNQLSDVFSYGGIALHTVTGLLTATGFPQESQQHTSSSKSTTKQYQSSLDQATDDINLKYLILACLHNDAKEHPLANFDHPNIVGFIGVFKFLTMIIKLPLLVMENMNKNLRSMLTKRANIPVQIELSIL